MDTAFRHRSDHLSSCDRVVHRTIVCSDKRVGTVQTCSIHVFGCRRGVGLLKSRNHQPNLMENGCGWREKEMLELKSKKLTREEWVGCYPGFMHTELHFEEQCTYFEMNSALTVLTTLSRTDTLYVGSHVSSHVLSLIPNSSVHSNKVAEQYFPQVQVPIHAHSLGNICQEALVRLFLKR